METNTSYVKNEPTVGMNFFENIPPVGVERNKKTTDLPPRFLWMSCKQTNVKKSMSKRLQFVVPCMKDGSIEKVEKLQNKGTVIGFYLPNILTEQNRTFLEERSNEGTMDTLVSLIRAIWDNYQLGQLITLVEYSAQAFQESLSANLGIDRPTTKAHGGDC
jgi:hypothetical protein